MKLPALFLTCFALLAVPARATVTIEIAFGELNLPDGAVGILVADVSGNGFVRIDNATVGTQLSVGQALGSSDDLIIGVIQADTGSHWSGQSGFTDLVPAIDYSRFGIGPGTALALYWFPDHLAPDGTLVTGDRWGRFRTDSLGGSGGTMGFVAPANWGVWRIAQLGAGQGGTFDVENPSNSGDFDSGFIPIGPPDSPGSLGIEVNLSDLGINLQWGSGDRARLYRIYRGTSDNFGSASEIGSTGTSSFLDTTATSIGTQYFYWVVSENPSGTSSPTSSVSGTRTFPAPAGLTASDEFEDEIALSWRSVIGATGYELFRSTGNQFGGSSSIVSGSTTSFTDLNVTQGISYFYWVTATNGSDVSPPSLVAVGVVPRAQQPDLHLGLIQGALYGDNIYSGDGRNQELRLLSRRGRRVKARLLLENDGTETDFVSLFMNRGGRTHRVTVIQSLFETENITAELIAGEVEFDLDPEDRASYVLSVKPGRGERRRVRPKTFIIQANSLDSPGAIDVTRSRVIVKKRRR